GQREGAGSGEDEGAGQGEGEGSGQGKGSDSVQEGEGADSSSQNQGGGQGEGARGQGEGSGEGDGDGASDRGSGSGGQGGGSDDDARGRGTGEGGAQQTGPEKAAAGKPTPKPTIPEYLAPIKEKTKQFEGLMDNKKVKGFRVDNLYSLWKKFWGFKDEAAEGQGSEARRGASPSQRDDEKKYHKPRVQGMKDLKEIEEEPVQEKNLWEKMIKSKNKK
ncbi:MAG TPA: hypothetical protein PK470_07095, partial [Candidatus Omnitrophota bacterium]|nr:hypothetical protein [Candidatus Omnitrophota bacterium]